MKVHLVDGTFELFRGWFGQAPKQHQGREVGAVIGLMRNMYTLLSEAGTTHVAMAFDHVIESFRNDLFSGYKTGEGIEPDLLSQFELAEDASRAMGFVTWPMVEFEADDAIATAANRFKKDAEVVICSPDKDFAQCVCEGVTTSDRIRGNVFDVKGIMAKFGVAPASIPDYLALVGDNSDGIPGIPRWGAVSAAKVLSVYHHLEGIPKKASEWTPIVRSKDVLCAGLVNQFQDALLYRTLATLRLDVPLKESLEDLRWRGPSHNFEEFCASIGETYVLKNLPKLKIR